MANENFTTYTEVDVNNKLTVTASRATGADVDRDEDVYLYKDKTVDHFDALDIDFELYMASTSAGGAFGGMAVANVIGSGFEFASTDITAFSYKSTGGEFSIYLYRGAAVAADLYVVSANTLYYCTLIRAAGNNIVTEKIYSDSGRTNLLDTLSVSGYSTTKYRYVYGFVNSNVPFSNNDYDGYVQNLDLNEPAVEGVGAQSVQVSGSFTRNYPSGGAGVILIGF